MPERGKVQIRHGNFIFSRIGFWCLLAVIVGAAYFAYYAVVIYAAVAAFLWVISKAWAYAALKKVDLTEWLSQAEVFPEDEVQLQITVKNHKFFPVPWLELARENYVPQPAAASASEQEENAEKYRLGWLLGKQEKKIQFSICPKRRGLFTIGTKELKSGDPFAFYQTGQKFDRPASLIVFPRLLQAEWFDLKHRDPLGSRPDQNYLYADPLFVSGVRDYQPYDSVRSLNWVASARFQTLKANIWEGKAAARCYVFLETGSLDPNWPEDKQELAWELLISSVATQVAALTERREDWGFLTDRQIWQDKSPRLLLSGANGSEIYLRQLFTVLGGLTREVPVSGLKDLFAQLTLPLGITFVMFSATYNPKVAEFLQVLSIGRRVYWFVLEQKGEIRGAVKPLQLYPGWENDGALAELLLNHQVPYEICYT
jgi:hypothetical protein